MTLNHTYTANRETALLTAYNCLVTRADNPNISGVIRASLIDATNPFFSIFEEDGVNSIRIVQHVQNTDSFDASKGRFFRLIGFNNTRHLRIYPIDNRTYYYATLNTSNTTPEKYNRTYTCPGTKTIYDDGSYLIFVSHTADVSSQSTILTDHYNMSNDGFSELTHAGAYNGARYMSTMPNPIQRDATTHDVWQASGITINSQVFPLPKVVRIKTTSLTAPPVSTIPTEVDIDLSLYFDYHENSTSSVYIRHFYWETSVGSKRYLHYIPHITGNGTSYYGRWYSRHKMFTFRVNYDEVENKNYLTFVDQQLSYPCYVKSIIPITNDWTKVVVVTDRTTHFFRFDEAQEKYVNTYTKNYHPECLGVSREGVVMTIPTTNQFEMFTLSSPASILMEMEKPLYTYEGTDIATHVKLSASDYMGDGVVGKFKLTCTEGAYFSANNSRELIVDLSGSYVNVPMKIDSEKSFNVFAKPTV
jgi:hypothetical protein